MERTSEQTIKCRRCKATVTLLKLGADEKKNLSELKRAGLDLQIVEFIQDVSHLDLKTSKALMLHINPIYGQCHWCHHTGLEGENVICEKCKSVNTNW